jgi:hypothetical protein
VHRARNLYVNLRERVKRAYRQALGEPPPRQTTTGNLSRGELQRQRDATRAIRWLSHLPRPDRPNRKELISAAQVWN